jgi:DnaJ-class molecular chaperone
MITMKTETIEICGRCNGYGYTTWEECVNPHKGDYEVHTETCKQCHGSGLLKVTVITERKVEAYTPPVSTSL